MPKELGLQLLQYAVQKLRAAQNHNFHAHHLLIFHRCWQVHNLSQRTCALAGKLLDRAGLRACCCNDRLRGPPVVPVPSAAL